MVSQNENKGGNLTPPNRAPAAKVLAGALANNRVAQSLITALGSHRIAAMIVATSTSQTTDFGALAVGDLVVMIPATAGNADFIGPIATAGTLGQAAVVGNLYMAFRAQNLDATNPIVPAGGQLTARQTGDGGQDF